MTDVSADAIIPRTPASTQYSTLQHSPSAGTRQYRHSTLFQEEEEWVEREPWADQSAYEEDDLLDAYFNGMYGIHTCLTDMLTTAATDAIPPAPLDGSETPTSDGQFSVQQYGSYPSYATRRGSLATSISSGSTGSSDGSTIAIKALHENSIIMLRVLRSLSFTEVRQRLYDKFVRQEGVPLSETFVVALLVPAPGAADKDRTVLHFVKSNADWDHAIYKYGNKVFLRVIGSSA